VPGLSNRCPYCFHKMRVSVIACDHCRTEIKGDFALPRFLELSADQQKFAVDFLLTGGSLKEVAVIYDLSYPTVRARLDRIIECLKEQKAPEEARRAAVLDALEEKKISAQEASSLLGRPSAHTNREEA